MSQSTPPQVPDFFSFTKNELKTHLLTYGVSVINGKTKDALAHQVKQHYINVILPKEVKKHQPYRW